jgi:hypothetical protein
MSVTCSRAQCGQFQTACQWCTVPSGASKMLLARTIGTSTASTSIVQLTALSPQFAARVASWRWASASEIVTDWRRPFSQIQNARTWLRWFMWRVVWRSPFASAACGAVCSCPAACEWLLLDLFDDLVLDNHVVAKLQNGTATGVGRTST